MGEIGGRDDTPFAGQVDVVFYGFDRRLGKFFEPGLQEIPDADAKTGNRLLGWVSFGGVWFYGDGHQRTQKKTGGETGIKMPAEKTTTVSLLEFCEKVRNTLHAGGSIGFAR